MLNQPLDEHEMMLLDDMLLEHGNDESILSFSELDGFLTAIVIGPDLVLPSTWIHAIWGGEENPARWDTETQVQTFMGLVFRQMNFIADVLMNYPEDYQAAFQVRTGHEDILIVDEWCFGFMRALKIKPWPELPEELETLLDSVRLHGLEENFEILDTLSIEEHQQTAAEIEPAVRMIHAWCLRQRMQNQVHPANTLSKEAQPIQFVRGTEKIGRNDPCPCGSGRKFKQCCLH